MTKYRIWNVHPADTGPVQSVSETGALVFYEDIGQSDGSVTEVWAPDTWLLVVQVTE